MTHTWWMFVGLLGGAALGLAVAGLAPAAAGTVVAVAGPLGTIWLNALQMTVVPLVVSLVVVGVAQAADIAATGRIARRSLAWILALSTASAALTAALVPGLLAAVPPSWAPVAILDAAAGGPATPAPPPTPAAELTALVPTNVVAAAASGAIAPLVLFTLCFSIALATLEPARRGPIVALAQTVADVMTRIVGWVLRAGPVGVAALILPVTVRAGGGVLGALAVYVLLLVTVYGVITALLYGLVRLGRGEPVGRFAAAILPAQVVAAGTQSSLASLPAMTEAARRLGYPAAIRGLVLPLAVSLFRVTSPAQYVAVAGFVAWSHGIELSPGTIAVVILLSVVISLGAVGLPGQASFMGTVLPVVQAAGLPVAPLGLLLAVDLVPDVFATVGNVTGDLALTSRIARDEGLRGPPEAART
jgi:proton glutamate symport protein